VGALFRRGTWMDKLAVVVATANVVGLVVKGAGSFRERINWED
jgi:hypothetical protein